MRTLGYPLYVNGTRYEEPVTISHVPQNGVLGATDPSLGAYVFYQPTRGMGANDAPLAPTQPAPAPAPSSASSVWRAIYRAVAFASSPVLAYHGYRRNDSWGWALGWAFFGGTLPLFAWPIALAQGFGKSKRALTPNRSRRQRRSKRRRASRGRRARRATKNPEDPHPWDDDRRYAVIDAETLEQLARREIGRSDIDPDLEGLRTICADFPGHASEIRALRHGGRIRLPNGDEIWRMR
jgi:hypothetical protein